jgi:hypothetical protein
MSACIWEEIPIYTSTDYLLADFCLGSVTLINGIAADALQDDGDVLFNNHLVTYCMQAIKDAWWLVLTV